MVHTVLTVDGYSPDFRSQKTTLIVSGATQDTTLTCRVTSPEYAASDPTEIEASLYIYSK